MDDRRRLGLSLRRARNLSQVEENQLRWIGGNRSAVLKVTGGLSAIDA